MSDPNPATNTPPWMREPEPPPRMTPAVLNGYNIAHDRLLRWLLILLAFVLCCFPINESSIYHSLRVGQMVMQGEFPFGSDPFGYGNGNVGWIHTGWLGDVFFYGVYSLGGSTGLVLFRALLLAGIFAMGTTFIRKDHGSLIPLLLVFFAILVVASRLFMRTEIFSYLCLMLTLRILISGPVPEKSFFHSVSAKLTFGHWHFLLPLIMILWVNLDSWFFLGPIIVVLWCLGQVLSRTDFSIPVKSLGNIAIVSTLVCLINPFTYKVFTKLPGDLSSTAYTQMFEHAPNQKLVPLNNSPFQLLKYVETAGIRSNQMVESDYMPFGLQYLYPSGLSLSEWAYYPFLILVFVSILLRGSWNHANRQFVIFFLLLVTVWQARHASFFAIGSLPLAILNWQGGALQLGSITRTKIIFSQLLRLIFAFAIIFMCFLMFFSVPDIVGVRGYAHPRGSFGFAMRRDSSYESAVLKIGQWRTQGKLKGNTFSMDWPDLPAYAAWFAPGTKLLFDSRLSAHAESVDPFFQAFKGLLEIDPTKPRTSQEAAIASQKTWKEVFAKYDVSHVMLRRSAMARDLSSYLLFERDAETGQPLFQLLNHTDGNVYVLAWSGSPHFKELTSLYYDPERDIFGEGTPADTYSPPRQVSPWQAFISGESVRTPASFDAVELYQQYSKFDPRFQLPFGLPIWIPKEYDTRLQYVYALSDIDLLATPSTVLTHLGSMSSAPLLPLVISSKNISIAPHILALRAANHGVSEAMAISDFDPRATLIRYQAFRKLADAHETLLEYEKQFTPSTTPLREQFVLMSIQNALVYGVANLRNSVTLKSLREKADQLATLHARAARLYLQADVKDIAIAHFRTARTLMENYLAPAQRDPQAYMKSMPSALRNMTGIDFLEEEKKFDQLKGAWKQFIESQMSAPNAQEDLPKLLQIAGTANQNGLVAEAEEILSNLIKSKPDEQFLLPYIQVLIRLGKIDQLHPAMLAKVRTRLGESTYHQLLSLSFMSRGDAVNAASSIRKRREIMDQEARQGLLDAQYQLLFGTSPPSINYSTVLAAAQMSRQASESSFAIAEMIVMEGLQLLEAGAPKEAGELFYKAIVEVEPNSPWKPLAGRYYQQITGKLLP